MTVFTSGTTSEPRAMVHTHAGLSKAFRLISTLLEIGPGDILYTNEFHTAFPALCSGATVHLPSERGPQAVLEELVQSNASHVFMVPIQLDELLDAAERRGTSFPQAVSTVLLGSAPVRPALLRRLYERARADLKAWCVYAMTELFPACAVEGREKLAFSEAGDLVGKPLTEVFVRTGDGGELLVSAPHAARGETLSSPIAEHHTGDIARIDAVGRVILLGRKKQMIIRHGRNIYPELYEPAIEQISGVRACAMVGVEDCRTGDERVALIVEPGRGYDHAWVRNRVQAAIHDLDGPLDAWAVPDKVIIASLPRSGRSLKVDRRATEHLAQAWLS